MDIVKAVGRPTVSDIRLDMYQSGWLHSYLEALVSQHYGAMKQMFPGLAPPAISVAYSLSAKPFHRQLLGWPSWPDTWPFRQPGGVYVVFDESEKQILYVGKAMRFKQRLYSWFGSHRYLSPTFHRKIAGWNTQPGFVRVISIEDPLQIGLVEQHLIRYLDPPENKHYRLAHWVHDYDREDNANSIACRNGQLSDSDVAHVAARAEDGKNEYFVATINGWKIELWCFYKKPDESL